MANLQPPENGVAIRMYRIGHGDCFLLAMPREGGGKPVYVLIDCGYKPGSPTYIEGGGHGIEDIVAHLGEATGFHLDLAIITHEHQDHLNGIWKKNEPYFKKFKIDEAWFAWTEDPDDELANQLRKRHKDQLLGLLNARQKLALAVGESDAVIRRVDTLLSLELGEEDSDLSPMGLRAAATDPSKSVNKQGLKLIKEKAEKERGVSYLSPGCDPLMVPGTGGIRVFVLGPPRDEDLLLDEDPQPGEGFPGGHAMGFSFAAAANSVDDGTLSPFSRRFSVLKSQALAEQSGKNFYRQQYGDAKDGHNETNGVEIPANAHWRRIDSEWLYSAESLALKLNSGINNTSLVLAFELPATKKVLLFVGDAQRGNWISWRECKWNDGTNTIDARDLLARTVLYKVGHHGSHNATLCGDLADDHANLSWMGTGKYAKEFTAMITAVNEWAMTKNDPPWRHPLPSIRKALLAKAQGRVFQTDIKKPRRPDSASESAWQAFLNNATFDALYFDYVVHDE